MFYVKSSEGLSYYVVVDDVSFKLPTVLKCLVTSLQLHMVFNLEYSPENRNVYIFLQRNLLKRKTVHDKRSPAVSELEKVVEN